MKPHVIATVEIANGTETIAIHGIPLIMKLERVTDSKLRDKIIFTVSPDAEPLGLGLTFEQKGMHLDIFWNREPAESLALLLASVELTILVPPAYESKIDFFK